MHKTVWALIFILLAFAVSVQSDEIGLTQYEKSPLELKNKGTRLFSTGLALTGAGTTMQLIGIMIFFTGGSGSVVPGTIGKISIGVGVPITIVGLIIRAKADRQMAP